MRKKTYKGRCEKKTLGKCIGFCKTYDNISRAYASILQSDESIAEIRTCVPLDGTEYMTDFLCIRTNGDMMVRECVYRSLLTKPMTAKNLDTSRHYWANRGISDWGIIINEEE